MSVYNCSTWLGQSFIDKFIIKNRQCIGLLLLDVLLHWLITGLINTLCIVRVRSCGLYFFLDFRNDNVPEFTQRTYSVMISEDTAIQQEVTTVLADDPDENDALTYRITSGGMCRAASNMCVNDVNSLGGCKVCVHHLFYSLSVLDAQKAAYM